MPYFILEICFYLKLFRCYLVSLILLFSSGIIVDIIRTTKSINAIPLEAENPLGPLPFIAPDT